MLLAVDIGNSNVKFALFDGQERCGFWHCATNARRTADEYAGFLAQAFQLSQMPLDVVGGAIVASVVPEATSHVGGAVERLFNVPVLIAGKDKAQPPIERLVDQPESVGADRLVAIMAARAVYPAPLLILDFGTATTFTVVNAEGHYIGGVIAPGVNISLTALFTTAAKLPKVELAPPPSVLAKNTIYAMQSGIYHGTIAMAEGLIARLSREAGGFKSVILSGGLSTLFGSAISGVTSVEPHLNLLGLRLLHKHAIARDTI